MNRAMKLGTCNSVFKQSWFYYLKPPPKKTQQTNINVYRLGPNFMDLLTVKKESTLAEAGNSVLTSSVFHRLPANFGFCGSRVHTWFIPDILCLCGRFKWKILMWKHILVLWPLGFIHSVCRRRTRSWQLLFSRHQSIKWIILMRNNNIALK